MEILEKKNENEISEIPINIEEIETYQFEYLQDKAVGDKELSKRLTLWGLEPNIHIHSFRFNLKFNEMSVDKFLIDLFNHPNVKFIVNNVFLPSKPCTSVTYKRLRTTLITLDLFNKLEEDDIVVPTTKYIKKTYEEECRGVPIYDKLREALIKEESDIYCVFNEEERKEVLFRLFMHLVLGGSMCQYEDYIIDYFEMTKLMYKLLVSPRKDIKTNQVYIESYAYEILKVENQDLFKDTENPQNFLYVIVSPSLRQVNIFTHKWTPFW